MITSGTEYCQYCDKSFYPVQVLTGNGRETQSVCPKCERPFAALSPVVAASINVARLADPKPSAATDSDPVSVLKARLAAVTASIPSKQEIAAMRKEQRGLVRALAALGVKPELRN